MCSTRLVPVEAVDRDIFTKMAMQHFQELDRSFVARDDWKESYFSGIQQREGTLLKWIQIGSDRAGFILYGTEDHRFLPRKSGAIYELYVKPEFRRRGAAREAATQAIDELKRKSPAKIQLEIVEGNAAAAALWRSLGFRKVSERYVLGGDSK